MNGRVRVTFLAIIGLAVGLLAHAVAQVGPSAQTPKPGQVPRKQLESPRPAVPPGQPLKAEQLTKEQFDRLPDSQQIEVQGQRMTAGEIRAKMRQARAEAEAKAKEAAQKAQAEFEAYRTKFLQEQKAKLDAANAKVQAEAARLRQQRPPAPATGEDPQLRAIRDEARQLWERAKTASPAEQQQIEARATQLLQQLQQRGVVVPTDFGWEQQMGPPTKAPGPKPQTPGQLPQRPGRMGQ